MPIRIHAALDRWRDAERALAAVPPDSPDRHDAEEAVSIAREQYLSVLLVVAEEQGTAGMPDMTETQTNRLGR